MLGALGDRPVTGPTIAIGATVAILVEGQMTVPFGLSPWMARGIGISAPAIRGGRRKP